MPYNQFCSTPASSTNYEINNYQKAVNSLIYSLFLTSK
jgi:hypothetical protein